MNKKIIIAIIIVLLLAGLSFAGFEGKTYFENKAFLTDVRVAELGIVQQMIKDIQATNHTGFTINNQTIVLQFVGVQQR